MPNHPSKRPTDPNQLAKEIVDLATMDDDDRRALKGKISKKDRPRQGSDKPGKSGSES
jgi:hypothetical protein